MIVLSKTDARCKKCKHFNNCNNKRLVMCKLKELPEPIAEKAAEAVTMPIANDIAVKHDYRQIKIAPNTHVTIDLEEEKKKMIEQFYDALRCDFMQKGG